MSDDAKVGAEKESAPSIAAALDAEVVATPASITAHRRFAVFYDPPAETRRMTLIFLACLFFSIVGLVLASGAKTESGKQRTREKLRAAAIALGGGLLTIGVITARYRPGGGYARGIVLELTGAEVRLWGRGYGTRVGFLEVARVRHRLVDTYLGRLGAMRQLRLAVEGGGKQIEVATEALVEDRARGLKAEGGEGDCVLLDRDDFDAFERALLARIPSRVGGAAATEG